MRSAPLFLSLLLAMSIATSARGAPCPGGVCPLPGGGSPAPHAAIPHHTVCRIENQMGNRQTLGSGTLIATTDAASYVVTCAHLFAEGIGRVVVRLPNQLATAGELIDIDPAHDLAVVKLSPQTVPPATLSTTDPRGVLTACGYGTAGRYRALRGPLIGYSTPQRAEYRALRLAIPVEQGDSGGGVFDEQGHLVAVVWGRRPGEAYATYGMPLHRILQRALRAVPTPPRPVVPLPQPDTHQAERPTSPTPPPSAACDCDQRWREHQQKLDQLAQELYRQRGPTADAPSLSPVIPVDSQPGSFLAGASWGKLLAVALGASGPVGVGIAVAGGLLARRTPRRGPGGPRKAPFR